MSNNDAYAVYATILGNELRASEAMGRKTGGRRNGTQNRFSVALKELMLQALSDACGAAYLTRQAENNLSAFMALVGRVLPLQVKDNGADPVVTTVVKHVYEQKEHR